ncbi:PEP-CTERM sorting domain-containing protein [Fontivita pretiosa]|uniref:PEP-CTERM sorting domain-containing protein n=1 Tax=Fontivita pretiosa TaxID=2989684 RepID=UPI003D17BCCB
MNRIVSVSVLGVVMSVAIASQSYAAPLTGSGVLPFPGATGDPPRDVYLASGTGPGPFTGTWPGAGPNSPPQPQWLGTFSATGPMPHTPPAGANTTGTTLYDFTVITFPNGQLPVGTYFQFGDLDNGSGGGELYRLRAFDSSGQILTPWLDEPFAASAGATAGDMPSYTYSAGVYGFDGTTVPGNPAITFYLKNNTAIERLEVLRTSTFTSFILAAPPIPEPASAALLGCGTGVCLTLRRRRRGQ